MRFVSLTSFAIRAAVAAVLVGACGSRTALFEPVVECVFPDEAKILDLVNDSKLFPKDYAVQCHLSSEQAIAVGDGRRYQSSAQLNQLPGLTNETCSALIECAYQHTIVQPCTPGNHPNVILELVVDESGSMTGEKWWALRDSLLALFDDIAADHDSALRVGVVMFDDVATSRVAPVALTQSGQLDDLRAVIDKDDPHGGGTSTKDALEQAFKVVDEFSSGERRVVVLLSDGSPTRGDEEKEECVDLVTDENFQYGTQLFSVGIGPFPSDSPSLYDPAFMGRLAVAGGSAPPGCDAQSREESQVCHYQVTPGGDPGKLKASFGAALDAIRESATTCP